MVERITREQIEAAASNHAYDKWENQTGFDDFIAGALWMQQECEKQKEAWQKEAWQREAWEAGCRAMWARLMYDHDRATDEETPNKDQTFDDWKKEQGK